MSCLKCKSDWVTATGKSCASCPKCCKIARCKARKEGRWSEGCKPRDCVQCGKTFTPEITRQNASTCGDECKKKHRKEWTRKNMREYRKGIRKCVQVHGTPMPLCVNCGVKEVKSRKHDHCSRKCFQESKLKGLIECDNTGQQLGHIRKCRAQGLPMPSLVMYSAIQDAMDSQLKNVADLWNALNCWRPCLHCGGPLPEHSRDFTMFCCIPCSASYPHEVQCGTCEKTFTKIGMQGRRRPLCRACKRKQINKTRRAYGKNIRDRAIRFGVERVPYNRDDIFNRDCWRCQLCRCDLLHKWTYNKTTLVPHPRNATIDHITPMSKGGADAEWNVQACCLTCNGKKSDSTKWQFRFRFA